MVVFLVLPFVTPSAMGMKPEIQAAEIPQASDALESATNIVDLSTSLFINTSWQTTVPTYSEIVRANHTPSTMESTNLLEIAPFLKAPSIENESISLTSSRQTMSLTSGYFSGHTWSWDLGTDDLHVEAAEVTRPLEGDWFPQESYARIAYCQWVGITHKFYFYVERGADTYSRYFRLYMDGQLLKQQVISGNYYSDYVSAPADTQVGYHVITLEINYGGYVEHGWKLRYWTAMVPDSESYYQPVRTDNQLFRKKGYSELEFKVPMGPDTKLNVETVNFHDLINRYLYVYVDGVRIHTLYSPGAYEVPLGYWGTPGMHDLKLVLYWGDKFTGTYPKAITQLYVSYAYRTVEVDCMVGHSQPQSVYDYAEAYYRTHDYRRVHFFENDTDIPYQEWVDPNIWNSLYNTYASQACKGNSRWTWGLYCNRVWYIDREVWGLGELAGKKFVIGDAGSWFYNRNWILMHEFGHTEGMDDYTGYKTDCYAQEQYHYDYMDWATPHYASSSWTYHLAWICGWW